MQKEYMKAVKGLTSNHHWQTMLHEKQLYSLASKIKIF